VFYLQNQSTDCDVSHWERRNNHRI